MKYRKYFSVFIDIFYVSLSLLLGTLMILSFVIYACDLHPHIFAKDDSSTISERSDIYELNWGVRINASSSEVFYTESDQRARGEGCRYHVYEESSGNTIVQPKSDIEDELSVTHGFGQDDDIDAFLSRVCQELDVPEEYLCSTIQKFWYLYQQSDGSTLAVIVEPGNRTYVAEELI